MMKDERTFVMVYRGSIISSFYYINIYEIGNTKIVCTLS